MLGKLANANRVFQRDLPDEVHGCDRTRCLGIDFAARHWTDMCPNQTCNLFNLYLYDWPFHLVAGHLQQSCV